MQFRSSTAEGTRAAARALASVIPAEGLVIGLVGPLGAGKTAFVKGLAEGLGLDPGQVSSPTFVIANQYAAPRHDLAHVDLYRLASAAELDDAGFLDMLEPGAVVAVEWADRLPEALPADRLELRIERPAARDGGAGDSRIFTAGATRRGSRAVLDAWQRALGELAGIEVLEGA